jgi:hypothetical protein
MQKGAFSFVLVHGFLDAGEIWRPVVDAVSPIVGGEGVAGITILTADAAGKISAIAIHDRPLPVRFASPPNSVALLRERSNPISSNPHNKGQAHDCL